jgi:CRP-like cAMP-binding protein
MNALDALRGCRVFGDLPDAELAALARVSRLVTIPRGKAIWREGDRAEALLIVAQGSMKVTVADPDGNEVVLHLWGEGDTAGEPALFSPRIERRLTNAEAIEDTRLLLIPREQLLTFLATHRSAMESMLARLADIVRQQTAMLVEAAFYDVAARVARRLLELCDSHGRRSAGGVRIMLPLPQRTLAGMATASRENVNRALRRLTAAGAIRRERGCILVINAEMLRRQTHSPRWKAKRQFVSDR